MEMTWVRTLDYDWRPCDRTDLNKRVLLIKQAPHAPTPRAHSPKCTPHNTPTPQFVFCPNHCEWEKVLSISETENTVTTEKQETHAGLIIPDYNSQYYTRQNLLFYIPQDTVEKLEAEKRANQVDKYGIYKDSTLAISIKNDPQTQICIITRWDNPTRNLNLSEKKFQYTSIHLRICETAILDMKKGEIRGHLPNTLTPQMFAFLDAQLKQNALALAGRKISFAYDIKKTEDIHAYIHCPFELKLYPLLKQFADLRKLNHLDLNHYNSVCNFLRIKTNRTVRRLFEKNALVLYRLFVLKEAGFTDFNLISRALGTQGDTFFRALDNNAITDIM